MTSHTGLRILAAGWLNSKRKSPKNQCSKKKEVEIVNPLSPGLSQMFEKVILLYSIGESKQPSFQGRGKASPSLNRGGAHAYREGEKWWPSSLEVYYMSSL